MLRAFCCHALRRFDMSALNFDEQTCASWEVNEKEMSEFCQI
jgi:hypothetical protein